MVNAPVGELLVTVDTASAKADPRVFINLARAKGGTPDGGRYLLAWAHAAGFEDVAASSSTWCYADETTRPWWAGIWSDRVAKSEFARGAVAKNLATEAELEALSASWLEWGAHPDGWFSIVHGEILCRACGRSKAHAASTPP